MVSMMWWTNQRVSKVNNLYTVNNIFVKIGKILERFLILPLMGNKIHIGLLETLLIMLYCS